MILVGIVVGLTIVFVAWFALKRLPVPRRGPPRGSQASGTNLAEFALGAEGAQTISLRLATKAELARPREPIVLPTAAARTLVPLLQQLPRAVVAGAQLAQSSTQIVLKFSPATTRALAEGSVHLVRSAGTEGAFRAIARGATGIREHGELVTRIDPRSVALAAWQVAAMVTAQKFLVDINDKLGAIEGKLGGLRAFLENSLVARLEADLAYMRDRGRALARGELAVPEHQAVVTELERMDRETRSISLQMLKEMSAGSEQLRVAKWGGFISVDEQLTQAAALIGTTSRASEKLILSAQVRWMALSVRAALGLSTEYTEEASKTLNEDLVAHQRAWEVFADDVQAKLPQLAATLRSGKTDEKYQGRVREILNAARSARTEEASACARSVAGTCAQMTALRATNSQMMEICFSLDPDGNPLEAARLLAP